MLGCIDYIASVAYHGGILLKPITTEKEITGHIGDTMLSWCEKGQKDDGGNEFRVELYEHNSIFHALSDGRTCAGYHWQYLDE